MMFASCWLLSSCSSISGALTPSDLTRRLGASATQHEVIKIQTVGYNYDGFYCGPAGLATLLSDKNRTVDLVKLSERLITAGKNGTFRADLTAQARKEGLIPITKSNQPELLVDALKDGEPVLALVNLSFNWAPQWHYFAVYGYDAAARTLLVHDGKGGSESIDSETFDRLWARANYWMMTLHEPDSDPAPWINNREWLDETLTSGSISAKTQLKLAETGLKRWPSEAAFAFILGDLAYKRTDLTAAIRYFERAITLDPKLMAGFYNLAYIHFETENYSRASESALKGLQIEGKSEVKTELHNLLERIQKKVANEARKP